MHTTLTSMLLAALTHGLLGNLPADEGVRGMDDATSRSVETPWLDLSPRPLPRRKR